MKNSTIKYFIGVWLPRYFYNQFIHLAIVDLLGASPLYPALFYVLWGLQRYTLGDARMAPSIKKSLEFAMRYNNWSLHLLTLLYIWNNPKLIFRSVISFNWFNCKGSSRTEIWIFFLTSQYWADELVDRACYELMNMKSLSKL